MGQKSQTEMIAIVKIDKQMNKWGINYTASFVMSKCMRIRYLQQQQQQQRQKRKHKTKADVLSSPSN